MFQATSKSAIAYADWYWEKWGLMDLPDNDSKSASGVIWFLASVKDPREQIEIIAVFFQWFSKQQINLSLFL